MARRTSSMAQSDSTTMSDLPPRRMRVLDADMEARVRRDLLPYIHRDLCLGSDDGHEPGARGTVCKVAFEVLVAYSLEAVSDVARGLEPKLMASLLQAAHPPLVTHSSRFPDV